MHQILWIKLYWSGVKTEGSLDEVIEYMKNRGYKHIIGAHKVSIYVYLSIIQTINIKTMKVEVENKDKR